MVITSATGAFGGGTTLIKMADLGRVRMRAQFNETDIGQIRAGQPDVRLVELGAHPYASEVGHLDECRAAAECAGRGRDNHPLRSEERRVGELRRPDLA